MECFFQFKISVCFLFGITSSISVYGEFCLILISSMFWHIIDVIFYAASW